MHNEHEHFLSLPMGMEPGTGSAVPTSGRPDGTDEAGSRDKGVVSDAAPLGHVRHQPYVYEPSAREGEYGAAADAAARGVTVPRAITSGAFANVVVGLSGAHVQIMANYWQNTINQLEMQEQDFRTHQLPLARIKKVMKSAEDIKMIAAEAPVLFAKGCEVFITELTMRAWIHAEENKRRTLQRGDIAMAISKADMFDFLIDIVPREDTFLSRPYHDAGGAGGNAAAAAAAAAASNSGGGLPHHPHPEDMVNNDSGHGLGPQHGVPGGHASLYGRAPPPGPFMADGKGGMGIAPVMEHHSQHTGGQAAGAPGALPPPFAGPGGGMVMADGSQPNSHVYNANGGA